MDQTTLPQRDEGSNSAKTSILDTVSLSRQSAALRTFNPQGLISEFLGKLQERERQILSARYGLNDGNILTLDAIGKKMNLTRERVRQIERDAIVRLRTTQAPVNFASGADLLVQIVEENGNAMSEERIIAAVLLRQESNLSRLVILFMLCLIPRFTLQKESTAARKYWRLPEFDQEIFEKTISSAIGILEKYGKPISKEQLITDLGSEMKEHNSSAEAYESYLSISKKIGKNPFAEWGLSTWSEINPKDVGDKAYLILAHLKKPEHYGKITELINKNRFDERIAQKETVHNELIKDKRFVLVGRGIYALASWGYKPGIVAHIIEEILRDAGQPLKKEEIIERVQKQRLVKRNTIIVGLSNKSRFAKTSENKYTPAKYV